MRKILNFAAAFAMFNCFAQHPQLAENNWYLSFFTESGAPVSPPVNDEIPYVAAVFAPNDVFNFATGACLELVNGSLNYTGTNAFSCDNFTVLSGGCSSAPNSFFAVRYATFWSNRSKVFIPTTSYKIKIHLPWKLPIPQAKLRFSKTSCLPYPHTNLHNFRFIRIRPMASYMWWHHNRTPSFRFTDQMDNCSAACPRLEAGNKSTCNPIQTAPIMWCLKTGNKNRLQKKLSSANVISQFQNPFYAPDILLT